MVQSEYEKYNFNNNKWITVNLRCIWWVRALSISGLLFSKEDTDEDTISTIKSKYTIKMEMRFLKSCAIVVCPHRLREKVYGTCILPIRILAVRK